MSKDSKNLYQTDHTVLADPKNIPWLTTLSPSSTLPSEEIVEQATDTSDGSRSDWIDDDCGNKLYIANVPVYAAFGQKGLGGDSSEHELTWANKAAEEQCSAPVEDSELFVNMGAALQDGEGNRDNTSLRFWERSLNENRAYYMAVPNEKYLLLIQHFIYKFPYFLRDDDGNPVDEKESREDKETYSDIRSIPFENLTWNPGANRGAKAIHPYVPGCACSTSDGAEQANGAHTDISAEAKPYADINLAYTDAIVPGSGRTMKHAVTHEDLAQMNYCSCNDQKNFVHNFEGIKPETRFGSEEFFTNILQKQGVDLSDYITEGQYAVFYVGFSPERHADSVDCHDQVGFRYAFAFNLKDRPVKSNPSSCQADPCFVAKHDDVQAYGRDGASAFQESQEDFGYNTAPKLYDVPQEIIDKYFVNVTQEFSLTSFMEVQYPGKIYMQYDTKGKDVRAHNVTDCLYLAGRWVDPKPLYKKENKANLTYYFKPDQPMLGIETSTDNMIYFNQNTEKSEWIKVTTPYYTQEEILADSPLNKDQTHGLSMTTQTLSQDSCNESQKPKKDAYNSVVSHQYAGQDSKGSNCEDGYCYEYNVHLDLSFDAHTKIAINNKSIFGTYSDGRDHLE
jgi:hypothetical protein